MSQCTNSSTSEEYDRPVPSRASKVEDGEDSRSCVSPRLNDSECDVSCRTTSDAGVKNIILTTTPCLPFSSIHKDHRRVASDISPISTEISILSSFTVPTTPISDARSNSHTTLSKENGSTISLQSNWWLLLDQVAPDSKETYSNVESNTSFTRHLSRKKMTDRKRNDYKFRSTTLSRFLNLPTPLPANHGTMNSSLLSRSGYEFHTSEDGTDSVPLDQTGEDACKTFMLPARLSVETINNSIALYATEKSKECIAQEKTVTNACTHNMVKGLSNDYSKLKKLPAYLPCRNARKCFRSFRGGVVSANGVPRKWTMSFESRGDACGRNPKNGAEACGSTKPVKQHQAPGSALHSTLTSPSVFRESHYRRLSEENVRNPLLRGDENEEFGAPHVVRSPRHRVHRCSREELVHLSTDPVGDRCAKNKAVLKSLAEENVYKGGSPNFSHRRKLACLAQEALEDKAPFQDHDAGTHVPLKRVGGMRSDIECMGGSSSNSKGSLGGTYLPLAPAKTEEVKKIDPLETPLSGVSSASSFEPYVLSVTVTAAEKRESSLVPPPAGGEQGDVGKAGLSTHPLHAVTKPLSPRGRRQSQIARKGSDSLNSFTNLVVRAKQPISANASPCALACVGAESELPPIHETHSSLAPDIDDDVILEDKEPSLNTLMKNVPRNCLARLGSLGPGSAVSSAKSLSAVQSCVVEATRKYVGRSDFDFAVKVGDSAPGHAKQESRHEQCATPNALTTRRSNSLLENSGASLSLSPTLADAVAFNEGCGSMSHMIADDTSLPFLRSMPSVSKNTLIHLASPQQHLSNAKSTSSSAATSLPIFAQASCNVCLSSLPLPSLAQRLLPLDSSTDVCSLDLSLMRKCSETKPLYPSDSTNLRFNSLSIMSQGECGLSDQKRLSCKGVTQKEPPAGACAAALPPSDVFSIDASIANRKDHSSPVEPACCFSHHAVTPLVAEERLMRKSASGSVAGGVEAVGGVDGLPDMACVKDVPITVRRGFHRKQRGEALRTLNVEDVSILRSIDAGHPGRSLLSHIASAAAFHTEGGMDKNRDSPPESLKLSPDCLPSSPFRRHCKNVLSQHGKIAQADGDANVSEAEECSASTIRPLYPARGLRKDSTFATCSSFKLKSARASFAMVSTSSTSPLSPPPSLSFLLPPIPRIDSAESVATAGAVFLPEVSSFKPLRARHQESKAASFLRSHSTPCFQHNLFPHSLDPFPTPHESAASSAVPSTRSDPLLSDEGANRPRKRAATASTLDRDNFSTARGAERRSTRGRKGESNRVPGDSGGDPSTQVASTPATVLDYRHFQPLETPATAERVVNKRQEHTALSGEDGKAPLCDTHAAILPAANGAFSSKMFALHHGKHLEQPSAHNSLAQQKYGARSRTFSHALSTVIPPLPPSATNFLLQSLFQSPKNLKLFGATSHAARDSAAFIQMGRSVQFAMSPLISTVFHSGEEAQGCLLPATAIFLTSQASATHVGNRTSCQGFITEMVPSHRSSDNIASRYYISKLLISPCTQNRDVASTDETGVSKEDEEKQAEGGTVSVADSTQVSQEVIVAPPHAWEKDPPFAVGFFPPDLTSDGCGKGAHKWHSVTSAMSMASAVARLKEQTEHTASSCAHDPTMRVLEEQPAILPLCMGQSRFLRLTESIEQPRGPTNATHRCEDTVTTTGARGFISILHKTDSAVNRNASAKVYPLSAHHLKETGFEMDTAVSGLTAPAPFVRNAVIIDVSSKASHQADARANISKAGARWDSCKDIMKDDFLSQPSPLLLETNATVPGSVHPTDKDIFHRIEQNVVWVSDVEPFVAHEDRQTSKLAQGIPLGDIEGHASTSHATLLMKRNNILLGPRKGPCADKASWCPFQLPNTTPRGGQCEDDCGQAGDGAESVVIPWRKWVDLMQGATDFLWNAPAKGSSGLRFSATRGFRSALPSANCLGTADVGANHESTSINTLSFLTDARGEGSKAAMIESVTKHNNMLFERDKSQLRPSSTHTRRPGKSVFFPMLSSFFLHNYHRKSAFKEVLSFASTSQDAGVAPPLRQMKKLYPLSKCISSTGFFKKKPTRSSYFGRIWKGLVKIRSFSKAVVAKIKFTSKQKVSVAGTRSGRLLLSSTCDVFHASQTDTSGQDDKANRRDDVDTQELTSSVFLAASPRQSAMRISSFPPKATHMDAIQTKTTLPPGLSVSHTGMLCAENTNRSDQTLARTYSGHLLDKLHPSAQPGGSFSSASVSTLREKTRSCVSILTKITHPVGRLPSPSILTVLEESESGCLYRTRSSRYYPQMNTPALVQSIGARILSDEHVGVGSAKVTDVTNAEFFDSHNSSFYRLISPLKHQRNYRSAHFNSCLMNNRSIKLDNCTNGELGMPTVDIPSSSTAVLADDAGCSQNLLWRHNSLCRDSRDEGCFFFNSCLPTLTTQGSIRKHSMCSSRRRSSNCSTLNTPVYPIPFLRFRRKRSSIINENCTRRTSAFSYKSTESELKTVIPKFLYAPQKFWEASGLNEAHFKGFSEWDDQDSNSFTVLHEYEWNKSLVSMSTEDGVPANTETGTITLSSL